MKAVVLMFPYLMITGRTSAVSCDTASNVAPAVVQDAGDAANLNAAINCTGGDFEVKWIGSVAIAETIHVLENTILNITGSVDGSSVIDGEQLYHFFEVVGGTLHLSGLTLTRGYGLTEEHKDVLGAVDCFNGALVTATGCTFADNVGGFGGAIYAFSSEIRIQNSTLVGNVGDYGGAIYAQESEMHIQNSIFVRNSAQYGGAINAYSSMVTLSGVAEFTDNHAGELGGGVTVEETNLKVGGEVLFKGNTAYSNNSESAMYGGGVHAANSIIRVSGEANFNANIAKFGAGAFIKRSDFVVGGDVNFGENNASDSGGAVYGEKLTMDVWGTAVFESNEALYGGALWLLDYCNLVVSGSARFTDNLGYHGGAGFISQGSSVQFLGPVIFASNRATQGGAVALAYSTLILAGIVDFFNNSAMEDGGGTVLWGNGSVVVSGEANFTLNTAVRGAVLMMLGGTSASFGGNVLISNNTASSSGGAIHAEAPEYLKINGTRFLSNTADIGGAMAMLSAGTSEDVVVLADCVFTTNKANDTGGALLIVGGFVDVVDSNFTGNIAGATLSYGAQT